MKGTTSEKVHETVSVILALDALEEWERLQLVRNLAASFDDEARQEMARERVAKGAELLDRHNGVAWRDLLFENQELFDISNATYCVLGIRFGDFGLGRSQLFDEAGAANAILAGFEADIFVSYRMLQEAWCELLGIEHERASMVNTTTTQQLAYADEAGSLGLVYA